MTYPDIRKVGGSCHRFIREEGPGITRLRAIAEHGLCAEQLIDALAGEYGNEREARARVGVLLAPEPLQMCWVYCRNFDPTTEGRRQVRFPRMHEAYEDRTHWTG